MKYKYIILIAVAMLLNQPANAQRRARKTYGKADTAQVVRNYIDSLNILRQRLDSIQQINDQLRSEQNDGRYFRLFAPTTFYHSGANKMLSLWSKNDNAVADAIDEAMMNIYLRRPDLVVNNESNLRAAGSIREDVNGSTIMEQAIEIKVQGNEKVGSLLVLNDTNLISHTDKNGNPINLSDTDISLSAKIADSLNVGVGDTIEWHIVGSDEWVKCEITNIHGEPLSQGIILSKDMLEESNLTFSPTSIITSKNVTEDYDSIKSISTLTEMKNNWDEMTGSVMMMVSILIFFAVLLAIVVLYNLGILSFTEIEREIATLKVLGFKTTDLRKLLLTQNVVFTAIGFILGVPLGFYLMTLMMNAAGESLYYIPSLTLGNIALSAVITFAVSIVVNLLFSSKIRNLNMVEALKDVD